MFYVWQKVAVEEVLETHLVLAQVDEVGQAPLTAHTAVELVEILIFNPVVAAVLLVTREMEEMAVMQLLRLPLV
jgi:hypothetical protein